MPGLNNLAIYTKTIQIYISIFSTVFIASVTQYWFRFWDGVIKWHSTIRITAVNILTPFRCFNTKSYKLSYFRKMWSFHSDIPLSSQIIWWLITLLPHGGNARPCVISAMDIYLSTFSIYCLTSCDQVLSQCEKMLQTWHLLWLAEPLARHRLETGSIDLLHKSHNAPVQISHNAPLCNRNVHMCAHFCYNMMHWGTILCWIVVFVSWIQFCWSRCFNQWQHSFQMVALLHPRLTPTPGWDQTGNKQNPGAHFTNSPQTQNLNLM